MLVKYIYFIYITHLNVMLMKCELCYIQIQKLTFKQNLSKI